MRLFYDRNSRRLNQKWFLREARNRILTFCGVSMGSNQYWAERIYDVSVYFMTRTPEGSTKSVFFCGAGNLTCDPWFTTFCCLWPCSLAVPVLAGWAYVLWWFNVQELRKAQPALILVLKRLRRRGNGLKSH